MAKLQLGCAHSRASLESVARRFDLIELELFDKPTVTRATTLRKWRKEAGPSLEFALVAPKALCAVRPTPALDEALAALLEAQKCLEARWIVLPTTIDVTPSPLQRERLQKLVERIREGLGESAKTVRIVWEPRGIWEADVAGSFARSLGVDLSVDPLADPREPFWHPALRYLRLRAGGGRDGVAPTRLRMIAELLAGAMTDDDEDGAGTGFVVVFATPSGATEAKRLRALVQQLTGRAARAAKASGLARVATSAEDVDDDEDDDDDDDDDDEGDDDEHDEDGEGSDDEGDDDDDDEDDEDDDDDEEA